MGKHFNKDFWIKHAIQKGYIIPQADGSVLRCRRASKTGKLLSDEFDVVAQQVHKKSGRVYFNMTWMGFTKSVLTNRVVAWKFYPNPLNLPQVNHIDGNKENNAKDNLEWSSGSDNERHAHRNGLKSGRGSQNSNAKLTPSQIVAIRKLAEEGIATADIAKNFGIGRSTVTNIVNRKTWKHV